MLKAEPLTCSGLTCAQWAMNVGLFFLFYYRMEIHRLNAVKVNNQCLEYCSANKEVSFERIYLCFVLLFLTNKKET